MALISAVRAARPRPSAPNHPLLRRFFEVGVEGRWENAQYPFPISGKALLVRVCGTAFAFHRHSSALGGPPKTVFSIRTNERSLGQPRSPFIAPSPLPHTHSFHCSPILGTATSDLLPLPPIEAKRAEIRDWGCGAAKYRRAAKYRPCVIYPLSRTSKLLCFFFLFFLCAWWGARAASPFAHANIRNALGQK